MPLQRRVPKGGFKNINRVEYTGVNLDVLQKISEEKNITRIDQDVFVNRNLLGRKELVKILGRGEVKTALEVHAHAFSATAKEAIEKAGGSVHIIG